MPALKRKASQVAMENEVDWNYSEERGGWSTIQHNRPSPGDEHFTVFETAGHHQLLYPKWTVNSDSNEMELRLAVVKALSAMKSASQREAVEQHRVWPEMLAMGF